MELNDNLPFTQDATAACLLWVSTCLALWTYNMMPATGAATPKWQLWPASTSTSCSLQALAIWMALIRVHAIGTAVKQCSSSRVSFIHLQLQYLIHQADCHSKVQLMHRWPDRPLFMLAGCCGYQTIGRQHGKRRLEHVTDVEVRVQRFKVIAPCPIFRACWSHS